MRKLTMTMLAGVALGAILLPNIAHAADSDTAAAMQGATPPAAAQEDDSPQSAGGDEILVTAQRREERLQDVPIAISAFSQATLAASGVRSTEDLVAVTPGLTIQRSGAGNTPFIRGIGSNSANGGSESPVATYIDGVYMPSLYTTGTSLLNIERVEVIKGPQGTLFGRNATGGVLQIVTRNPVPDEFSGALRASYGNYDTLEFGGYLNTGIAEDLAANFTFFVRDQGDGYGTNLQTGNATNFRNEHTFMGKVRYDSGATSVTLSGYYSWFNDPRGFQRVPVPGSTGRGAPGGPPALSPENYGGDYWDVNHGQDAFVRTRAYGGSITIAHEFDAFDLVSVSAVTRQSSDLFFDNDFGYADLNASRIDFFDNSMSQEIRLSSRGSGPFSWIVGLYGLSLEGGNVTRIFVPASTLASYIAGTVRTQSFAAFGEVAYQLSPRDKLTIGGRFTIDHRETSGQFGSGALAGPNAPATLPREATWREPTYRIVYDHKFTDDIMAYASYNRGFRSGNFNVLPATTPAFDPEFIDAYEIGLKTQFFDRAVRFNIAGYYYDYQDLQLNATTQFGTTTVNAASAEIKGIDLELSVRPVRGLTLDFGGSFLDAEYGNFPNAQAFTPNPAPTFGYTVVPGGRDASGRPLVRTPSTTASGGVAYNFPTSIGEFTASTRISYNSGFNHEIFGLSKQSAYTLVNAGLAWESPNETFNARVDVSNLFNQEYSISGNVTDTAAYYVAATPRVVMFTVGTKF